MVWNPGPEVAAARDIGNKFGWDQVVILGINRVTRKYGVTTYGKTKRLCAETKLIGDQIGDLVGDGIIEV